VATGSILTHDWSLLDGDVSSRLNLGDGAVVVGSRTIEYSPPAKRWSAMRVRELWIIAVFALPSLSQAKPSAEVVPLELQPMSGPFSDLTAACEHLKAAVPSESESAAWVAPARCNQIDAAGSAAVLLTEREEEGRRDNRLYAVVLHRRDGWWMSPDVAHSYRDGEAAGHVGGNCCSPTESPPTYAVWGDRVAGLQGTATVLRVVMHGWSVGKKGWPGEGEVAPNSKTLVSFTICGTTSMGAASCYVVRSTCGGDSDRSQVPRYAIEDNHVVLQCPERKR
jgi:hypothetical protein